MAVQGFDPEIIQDFLTESGELLEALDQDLVALESSPQDPELLNKVFRALHTIKGSASFLALTNLVELAHAAESALNAARNQVFVVGKEAMDLLLAAVDTLRRQFDDLRAGRAVGVLLSRRRGCSTPAGPWGPWSRRRSRAGLPRGS